MIEIKDTRKTATKDPRVKIGGVVRIDNDYYICCQLDNAQLNVFSLTDGYSGLDDKEPIDYCYVFSPSQLKEYDIEVITNKITLTIE